MRGAVATLLCLVLVACAGPEPSAPPRPSAGSPVEPSGSAFTALPPASRRGGVPLHEALAARRSVRDFTEERLSSEELGQLLWAAQGITSDWGGRTAPSAGALYPLELYLVTAEGLCHYLPARHGLETLREGDLRAPLAAAALAQGAVSAAPAVIVLTAVVARTEAKYGSRAERYVQLEAGHAAQNVLLQAVSLGLGAVPMGAFQDDAVRGILGLPGDHTPLYLIPVGHPRNGA